MADAEIVRLFSGDDETIGGLAAFLTDNNVVAICSSTFLSDENKKTALKNFLARSAPKVAPPPPIDIVKSMKDLMLTDNSTSLWKQLLDVTGVALPALDGLKDFLSKDFLQPIYTSTHHAELPPDVIFSPYDAASTNSINTSLADIIEDSGFRTAKGQNGIHHLIDSLILSPLNKMNAAVPLGVFSGRNTTDNKDQPSTGRNLRPDFLCWVKDCLIFRGEEEDSNMEKAKAALSRKLVWNPMILGNLPYIFGYSATRDLVELFALTNKGTTSIAGPYNINTVGGRIAVFRAIVNMYRLFRVLAPSIPTDVPALYSKFKKDSSTITFYGDHVTKALTPPSNWDSLKELYKLLRVKQSQYLVRTEVTRDLRTTVHLKVQPLGLLANPKTEDELRTLIKDVLTGLQDLHKLGYAHNDVRWPNILRIDVNRHVLCDLECATRIPVVLSKKYENQLKASQTVVERINEKAPEAAKTGGTEASDIWLVGKLFEKLPTPIALSPAATSYRDKLLLADPEQRLKMVDALKLW